MTVTADHLRKVLTRHAPLVDLALEQFFPDPEAPLNLDGLSVLTDDDQDLADVLKDVLESRDLLASLETFLNARGIALAPDPEAETFGINLAPLADADIPTPVPNDFPIEKEGKFALRAASFRCRIQLDGVTEGSGAFVSNRLVLTAGHVVEKVIRAREEQERTGQNEPVIPKIGIVASDGRTFSARCVWYSPVHENERLGQLPPVAEAAAFQDVALLQVSLPVGLSYGYVEMPKEPVNWDGSSLMALVHFPDGMVRGLTRGRVLREGPDDLRLRHDVDTAGGSSGGVAFDRNLEFIGIHQGRWNDFRKLVPHPVFAGTDDFRKVLASDNARRYLWSLEDDIDGHLIIGRQKFFEGLAAMVEAPASHLRGIWIRRLDTTQTTGLSFSFEMLRAFLTNRIRPSDIERQHACFRIATDLEEVDLIGTLARAVLGAPAAAAAAGVGAGETSDVAEERDRALQLARDIQQKAAGHGTTYWLFFDAPPDGKLSDAARTQFEHLAEWLITHPNIRLVLAGFEQYALAPLKFQNIDEIETARRPGLLVDPLGNFSDADVEVTLTAMLSDLAQEENINPLIMEDLVAQVTRNMQKTASGLYAFENLARAVEKVRAIVKLRWDRG